MPVELVRKTPHEWSFMGDWHDGSHTCFLCKPLRFPPMPPRHTLCARCGDLISVPKADPLNYAMAVCPECEQALATDANAEV
jgi:hypothetical protein